MSANPRPSAPTLAYLSAPGSISLPPPFPAAYAGKGGKEKSRSSMRDGAQAGAGPSSTPRILLGAAIVTAAKTFVLDAQHEHRAPGRNSLSGWNEEVDNGGVALSVMALCAGRIVVELRSALKDRRNRGKGRAAIAPGTPSRMQQRLLHAALAAVQVIAYLMAVKVVGPLRASILAAMGASSYKGGSISVHSKRSATSQASLVPGLLSVAFVLFDAHKRHGPMCLVTLTTLLAITMLLCTSQAGARPAVSKNADVKRQEASGQEWPRMADLGMFALACTAVVTCLAIYGVVSPPHIVLNTAHTAFALPVLIALLISYCPLPTSSSLGLSPAAKLERPRQWIVFLSAITTLQFFALHPRPSIVDALVLLPAVIVSLYTAPRADSHSTAEANRKSSTKAVELDDHISTARTSTWDGWTVWSLIPAAWRPHLRTILHTDSSRKIFYFLLVNLAYMGVQLGYGVYTNSLGLISDAIHMFFDCLGIGVGLWASIAATWKPDGRYTFGYGRVETLSGFANGLFLILISIFIVFEGIQRIMNPPEMRTHQLLLVSSIGLGINLFGMWATGGHHHHGHGHSHGHDHGHSHGHSHDHHGHSHADHGQMHVHAKKEDHMHECSHDHVHAHASAHDEHPQQYSHSRQSSGDQYNVRPGLEYVRRRPSQMHLGQHGHSHSPSHSHSHSHGDQHGDHDHHSHSHDVPAHATHAHDEDHDHDHGHGHAHAHSHHDHGHSHNMRGVFLHVMADTLGSVGVIISTILIRYTGWTIFDPIASLFIAILIMASVIPLVIDSGRVLCLDVGVDVERDIKTALTELSNVPGLASFSAPRLWPRNEGEFVCSIHIQLALSETAYSRDSITGELQRPAHSYGQPIYAKADRVVGQVKKVLKNRVPGLSEVVVQVEGSEEPPFCDCMTGGG